MRLALLVLLACACLSRAATAQCADGSPPPCSTRRPAAVPAPTLDANRVALLPFRVAASDTLLGEGFAELLASEFTGRGMPRAVDMGTALQAWRRAGGGLRSALSREQTFALARSLGAGIVSEGSIVGLGRQLTVTASLVDVATGRPRSATARVTVPADSIDYALRRVAAILTAPSNAPAQVVISDDARVTESPEALRDYLEGMALWRRGRLADAARAWDRALARDSLFARAMFRRLIAQTWGTPGNMSPQRVMALQDRLSDAERTVMVARYGRVAGGMRTLAQTFEDTETAVQLLPDNADALYTAADAWHHIGAMIDPDNHLRRAVGYFSRAAAIDSQATVIQHLTEAAYRLRDTALMRRSAAALERTGARSRWQLAWLTAAYLRDEAWLNRLRAGRPEPNFSPAPYLLGRIAATPAALYDEMFERWFAVSDSTREMRAGFGMTLIDLGRPAAAQAQWSRVFSAGLDDNAGRVAIGTMLSGGQLTDTTAAERWVNSDAESPSLPQRRCMRTALALSRGLPAAVDTGTLRPGASPCALAVKILAIPTDQGAATVTALAALDSAVRARVVLGNADAFLPKVLSSAWERAGRPVEALRAIRYREIGGVFSERPGSFADEGRLAAIVGDTAGARRAYTLYLEMMQGAEPAYDASRAEARAALARLQRPVP